MLLLSILCEPCSFRAFLGISKLSQERFAWTASVCNAKWSLVLATSKNLKFKKVEKFKCSYAIELPLLPFDYKRNKGSAWRMRQSPSRSSGICTAKERSGFTAYRPLSFRTALHLFHQIHLITEDSFARWMAGSPVQHRKALLKRAVFGGLKKNSQEKNGKFGKF